MEVTYEAVAQAIVNCYETRPVIAEDYMYFGLEGSGFTFSITISLIDSDENSDDAIKSALIGAWFCDAEGEALSFGAKTFTEMLEFCHKLQTTARWGTFIPVEIDDKGFGISYKRCIDLTAFDVALGSSENLDSELLRTIDRLCSEFEDYSQIILMVAGRPETSPADIELLFEVIAGTA